MKQERLSPLERLRERSERFDNLCYWLGDHWADVVLWVLAAAIIVLLVILAFVMSSCTGGSSAITGGTGI